MVKMQTANKEWKENFQNQLRKNSEIQKDSNRQLQQTIESIIGQFNSANSDARNDNTTRYIQEQNRQRQQAGLLNRTEAEELLRSGLMRPEDVYGTASSLPSKSTDPSSQSEKSDNLSWLWERYGFESSDLDDALRQRNERDVRVREWELEPDSMPVELLEPAP